MATLTYTEPPLSPKLLSFYEFACKEAGTLGRIEAPGDMYHGLFVMALRCHGIVTLTQGRFWSEVASSNHLKVFLLLPNSTITLTQEGI